MIVTQVVYIDRAVGSAIHPLCNPNTAHVLEVWIRCRRSNATGAADLWQNRCKTSVCELGTRYLAQLQLRSLLAQGSNGLWCASFLAQAVPSLHHSRLRCGSLSRVQVHAPARGLAPVRLLPCAIQARLGGSTAGLPPARECRSW